MSDLSREHSAYSVPPALGIGVVGLLFGLMIWRAVSFGTPYGGDWAQYMAHAKALVEGRPYADTGYIFTPYAWQFGPVVFPPGLPLTLTPFIAMFGDSMLVPRVIMHGFLALFLFAVYRYFARDGERTIALGAVALLGTSFLLNSTANVVGSDLGMCALVWCALTLGEATDEWSWGRTGLIALLVATALTFRVAAAPIIPAVALWALLRYRTVGWRPWVVVLFAATALLVVMAAFGPGEQATEAASRRLVGPDGKPMPDFARWWGRSMGRLSAYRFALSDAYLYPFPSSLANRVYHVLAMPVMLVGIAGWVRREWTRLGIIFGVGTIGMLVVLPVWAGRYAWIITPFACFGLVRGIMLLFERLPRFSGDRAARASVFVALGLAVIAATSSRSGSPASVEDDTEDWAAIGLALEEWAGGDPIRAASNRPRVLSWHTGIPGAGIPSEEFEVFVDEAERLGLTAVVISHSRPEEPAYHRWLGWLRDHPEHFSEVASSGDLGAYEIVAPVQP